MSLAPTSPVEFGTAPFPWPKTGPGKGTVSGLDKMLPEYYKVRGWDNEGRLSTETRKRLGL